jgi:hypothetical protein
MVIADESAAAQHARPCVRSHNMARCAGSAWQSACASGTAACCCWLAGARQRRRTLMLGSGLLVKFSSGIWTATFTACSSCSSVTCSSSTCTQQAGRHAQQTVARRAWRVRGVRLPAASAASSLPAAGWPRGPACWVCFSMQLRMREPGPGGPPGSPALGERGSERRLMPAAASHLWRLGQGLQQAPPARQPPCRPPSGWRIVLRDAQGLRGGRRRRGWLAAAAERLAGADGDGAGRARERLPTDQQQQQHSSAGWAACPRPHVEVMPARTLHCPRSCSRRGAGGAPDWAADLCFAARAEGCVRPTRRPLGTTVCWPRDH